MKIFHFRHEVSLFYSRRKNSYTKDTKETKKTFSKEKARANKKIEHRRYIMSSIVLAVVFFLVVVVMRKKINEEESKTTQ